MEKLEEKKTRASALKLTYSPSFLWCSFSGCNQIYNGLLEWLLYSKLYSTVQSNFTMSKHLLLLNDGDDDHSSATIRTKMSTHRNFNYLLLASSNSGRTKQSKEFAKPLSDV